MIVIDQNAVEAIEFLVGRIKNNLYNEDARPFPEFALKEDFVSLIWHEVKEDESDGNSWINQSKFLALKEAKECVSDSKSFYIAWAYRELDENDLPLARTIIELPYVWEEVEKYEGEVEYHLSQFYVFDSSLTWFLHIDDSVLLAGNKEFIANFVENIGGIGKAKKMFEDYLEDVNSQDVKSWVDLIRNRFLDNFDAI